MKHLKTKGILAFLVAGTFILTPHISYAKQQDSALVSMQKTTTDASLTKLTTSKKSITIEQGTSEEDFRKQFNVKAWYSKNDYKEISDYTTDYDSIKDTPGKHKVKIMFTDNGKTACAQIIVCITEKPDIDTSKEIKHISYLEGYEDGTFRANGNITRGEMATMIGRLMLDGVEPTIENIFEDTEDTRYSTPYISYVVQQGIMEGYEDSTFRPEDKVTREEMKDILMHLTVIRKPTKQGVLLKDEGYLTRAESVNVLNKIFDRECSDVEISNPYTDLSSDLWAYNDIMYASIEHTHTSLSSK